MSSITWIGWAWFAIGVVPVADDSSSGTIEPTAGPNVAQSGPPPVLDPAETLRLMPATEPEIVPVPAEPFIPPDITIPATNETDSPEDPATFFGAASTDDRPESLLQALGLGSWRTRAKDRGVSRRRTITLFYQGLASGGAQQEFAFAPKMDSFIEFDFGKLAGLEGFAIDFHLENRFGQSVNPIAASVLPVNFALQFPQGTGQASALTNLQFRQRVTDDISVFFGKLNTADRYGLHPFLGGFGTDRFQNTALVVNPAFGRAVPYSTLGAGASWNYEGEPVATVLVVDPTGEPDTAGFAPMLSNGVSLMGQLRLPVRVAELPGHQTFEAAWSSGSFSPTLGDDYVLLPESGLQVPRRAGTWAVNYGFDQFLVHDDSAPGRGWGVFGNFTWADAQTNPVEYFANFGVAGRRLFRSRPGDSFGVAGFYTGLNESLRNPGPQWTPLSNQLGFEMYYDAEITRWFRVTFDMQAVESAMPDTATGLLFGIRGRIVF